MIERPLERPGAAAAGARPEHAPSAPAAPAPRSWPGRVLVVGLIAVILPIAPLARFCSRLLGSELGGLELGRDQRIVLGPQIDLVGVVRGAAGTLRSIVLTERILPLELFDIAYADFELVRDPSVGATLPHPGSDLI
jgi:hypothetical protein